MRTEEQDKDYNQSPQTNAETTAFDKGAATCPACGGTVRPIRCKWICTSCRTIVETCCDGGRQ